jgi:hypothetical protein
MAPTSRSLLSLLVLLASAAHAAAASAAAAAAAASASDATFAAGAAAAPAGPAPRRLSSCLGNSQDAGDGVNCVCKAGYANQDDVSPTPACVACGAGATLTSALGVTLAAAAALTPSYCSACDTATSAQTQVGLHVVCAAYPVPALAQSVLYLQARDDAAPGTLLANYSSFLVASAAGGALSFSIDAPDPLLKSSSEYSYSLAPFALGAISGLLTLAQPALLGEAQQFALTARVTNSFNQSAVAFVYVTTSRTVTLAAASVAASIAFGASARVAAPSLLRPGSGGAFGAPLVTTDANALMFAQVLAASSSPGLFTDLDVAKAVVSTTAASLGANECGLSPVASKYLLLNCVGGDAACYTPASTPVGVYTVQQFAVGVTSIAFASDTSVGFILAGGGGGGGGGNTVGNSGSGGGSGGGVAFGARGVLMMRGGVAYK